MWGSGKTFLKGNSKGKALEGSGGGGRREACLACVGTGKATAAGSGHVAEREGEGEITGSDGVCSGPVGHWEAKVECQVGRWIWKPEEREGSEACLVDCELGKHNQVKGREEEKGSSGSRPKGSRDKISSCKHYAVRRSQ